MSIDSTMRDGGDPSSRDPRRWPTSSKRRVASSSDLQARTLRRKQRFRRGRKIIFSGARRRPVLDPGAFHAYSDEFSECLVREVANPVRSQGVRQEQSCKILVRCRHETDVFRRWRRRAALCTTHERADISHNFSRHAALKRCCCERVRQAENKARLRCRFRLILSDFWRLESRMHGVNSRLERGARG